MLSAYMRPSSWLIGITAILGIGLFLVIFIWSPTPPAYTFFPKVYLPQAADKVVITPTPVESQELEIMFVGDIMLARAVERSLIENGPDWPFAGLGEALTGADLVIGNLEGTVRPTRNLEVVNQMTFDTTPNNLSILEDVGFTHLSLSNNHSDDYGSQVTLDTRQSVVDAGMMPFGDPLDSQLHVVRENLNGWSISLVGYHAFGDDLSEVVAAVEHEDAQGRFVIAYPHWGPEYVSTAANTQTLAAKSLVTAGADLIVGAHPHVIQNYEVIDDVPVIYSLGNFLFDQDFSTATQQGLILKVKLSAETLDLNFVPVSIKNRQTFPMPNIDAQAVLSAHGLGNGNFQMIRNKLK